LEVGTYEQLASHLSQFEEKEETPEPDYSPVPSSKDDKTESKDVTDPKATSEKKKGTSIVESEERVTGQVSWDCYSSYFESFQSPGWITVVILAAIINQVSQQGLNVWLSWWTRDSFELDLAWYMGIYAALGVSQGVFTYVRTIGVAILGVKGSATLHARLYDSVLSSRLDWFDKTPVGRYTEFISHTKSEP